jgi:hypothetical protein
MTKLHEWEVIHSVTVQDHGTCAMTRRLAVPGGWVYELRAQWGERKLSLVWVPDPAAPHCQPTPAEGPPMTDEALVKWLTATYGEELPSEETAPGAVQWRAKGTRVIYDERWADADAKWSMASFEDVWLPADVVGPALWAAHKYGAKP